MKRIATLLFILCSLFFARTAFANLDSLNALWHNPSLPDSVRLEAGCNLAWDGFLFSRPDTAFLMAEVLCEQAQKGAQKKWLVYALNIQGVSCAIRGIDDQSLMYFKRCLKLNRELGLKTGVANMLNNIGLIYLNQEKLIKAMETFKEARQLREELDQPKGMATTLNDIGLIYVEMEEYDKAHEVFWQSMELKKKLKNPKEIAATYNNIGLVYQRQDSLKQALKYYQIALDMRLEANDSKELATSYNNLGDVYLKKGEYTKALGFLKKSLAKAKEIGWPDRIASSAGLLSQVYEKQGDFAQALEHYKLLVTMQDSIRSDEIAEQLIQAESRGQFEKEMLRKEQQQKETARLAKEAEHRRNNLQYSGIGVGVLFLFGLVFLLVRIRLPHWALDLATFLPFLILFEFLLVITDPWVEEITGGEPLFKLLINALLAGLIFPLHSFFEGLLKKRLFKAG